MAITKDLPLKQLNRALKFGAQLEIPKQIDHWVDAYLGFSQRLPLPKSIIHSIQIANSANALKTSLDIPVGISKRLTNPYFKSNQVVSLAAPKILLNELPNKTKIYISDLGIPKEVYLKFNTVFPPFNQSSILEMI